MDLYFWTPHRFHPTADPCYLHSSNLHCSTPYPGQHFLTASLNAAILVEPPKNVIFLIKNQIWLKKWTYFSLPASYFCGYISFRLLLSPKACKLLFCASIRNCTLLSQLIRCKEETLLFFHSIENYQIVS